MPYPRRHFRPWLSITGSRLVIPCRHLVIAGCLRRGRDLRINTDLYPVSSITLLCMSDF
ncbi:unnamed protein product [Staurois parvus]|uniref:Uncharacterized protein n=1 Tax=Staurois parvus TaxID=386267 RepID=A0ABN9B649_9NEOB|nr:unnamed protein product [Staurois parvus]